MTSPAPLTEAEQCVEATMLRHLTGVPIPDWTEAARAVVAAVRPALWSEAVAFLRSIADEDGVRLAADILDNAALSLPASKETPDAR